MITRIRPSLLLTEVTQPFIRSTWSQGAGGGICLTLLDQTRVFQLISLIAVLSANTHTCHLTHSTVYS